MLIALVSLPGLEPWAASLPAQEPDNSARNYEFFSGVVMELSADRLTVERTVLGKSDQKKFTISPETKVEGTLKKGARVTVGYNPKADEEVAVRIIVREE